MKAPVPIILQIMKILKTATVGFTSTFNTIFCLSCVQIEDNNGKKMAMKCGGAITAN